MLNSEYPKHISPLQ